MTDTRALQERALARMRAALNYWLVTTMPSGAPHAVSVWGVWLNGALWFGTGDQKRRNLAADPRAVVHLDSADDVVMLCANGRSRSRMMPTSSVPLMPSVRSTRWTASRTN